ncbi:hypothetical protein DFJ58DRAFT_619393, partial [Suillus subalutaceus]|uniref:uncharacterized protein n=1 Tax=Suillus subalutaceus TaxID=48586 RepID=UPI001B85DD16
MPPLMGNPNHAIAPNFQLLEHAEARAQLVNDAIDDQQAAAILANLWRIQNEADKRQWAARIEAEAREAEAQRREEAEEEAQCQQTLREEQEAAIQEECKKNKAKYAPIKDTNVPSDPIILPCQYAAWKMKSGNYCKLFYFTNSGLEEASRSAFTADEDALVVLPTSDSLNKWIPAAAARDPKAQIIKDENLTWEQFNEAAPRMVSLM